MQTNSISSTISIKIFFSLVIICMSVIVWLARLPILSTPEALSALPSHARILIFGLSLLWIGVLIPKEERDEMKSPNCLYFVARFSSFLLLLFLPFLIFTFLPTSLAAVTIDFTLLLVVLIILWNLRSMLGNPSGTIYTVLLAIIFSLALSFSIFEKDYMTPFAPELAILGDLHRDTYFHATISNIVTNFNEVSVGLDGLVQVGYHVLSHRLIGSIGLWLNLDYFASDYLYFYIVAVPLLFSLLLDAVLLVRDDHWTPVLPVQGTILFLSMPIAFSTFSFSSYFSSDSYVLSLILMLAAFPLLYAWIFKDRNRLESLLVICCLMIGIYLVSQAKISTGAVFTAGVGFSIAMHGGINIKKALLGLVVAFTPFAISFLQFSGLQSHNRIEISPLHYLLNWKRDAIFHLALFIFFFFLIYKTPLPNPLMRLFIYTLSMMSLCSISASMLLDLPAGAAGYFANPGMWVALVGIGILGTPLTAFSHRSMLTQTTFAVAIFVLAASADLKRWTVPEQYRLKLSEFHNKTNNLDDQSISTILRSTSLIESMRLQISEATTKHKNDILIHVSPLFEKFWKANPICWAQSFVLPAVSGQPMLMGLPPLSRSCKLTKNYGISSYNPVLSSSRNLEDHELCHAAKERGFGSVITFSNINGRVLNCL